VTDDALLGQLRAYAHQLDELPAAARAPLATELHARPPRRSRRVLVAVAVVIAVAVAIALPRVLDQPDGTGPSVGTGGAIHVARAWTRDLGAQMDQAIDVPGDRTIVDVAPETTGDSTLVALDRSSGKVLWRHRFPYRNGPWGLDGNVLVTGVNGRTAGIDVRTGKQVWLVDVNAVSGEQSPPILVHDHVAYLVGGDDGVMTALQVPTHRVLWRQTLGGTTLVTPVVGSDGVAVAVSPLPLPANEGRIVFLDPADGTMRTPPVGVAVDGFAGLVDWPAEGVAVATASDFSSARQVPDCGSRCFELRANPDLSAKRTLDGTPAPPLVLGDTMVIATAAGTTTGFRADTTNPFARVIIGWSANVGPSEQPGVGSAAGNAIVAGGTLTALRPRDGSTVWTAPVRDGYLPVPATGDVVVATSRTDGHLYVIDAHDGHVVTTVRDGTAQIAVTLARDSMVTASARGIVTGYRITGR
jgi:outer membrane protein assembly factor BamB